MHSLLVTSDARNLYPDLEILINPIKGCLHPEKNQLLTIYQGVHITYFITNSKDTGTTGLAFIN